MKYPLTFVLLATLCSNLALAEAEWPQWRGPNRDGISQESGLLPAWPEGGPVRLWQVETEGEGYGSPVVAGGVLYVTGSAGQGNERKGLLHALNPADGATRWTAEYGPVWHASFDRERCTPTVSGGRIYVVGSLGQVVCFKPDGTLAWRVDTAAAFGGRNIRWGIAESPLVTNGLVISHPGGPDAALMAFDAATGAVRWRSTGFGERSAYCSPQVVTWGGRKIIVTQTEDSVAAIALEDGKLLWRHPHRNQHAVHPNTPVAPVENRLLVASGYGYGAELLAVEEGQVKRLWLKPALENHFQGIILNQGAVYSCNSRGLQVYDPLSGEIRQQLPAVGKAQITLTPVGLIAYNDKGQVMLVRIQPSALEIAGKFKVDFGSGEHWSTPVVAGGRLFVRHGAALAAYELRAVAAPRSNR